ncbi:hypothetical protein [Blastococcus litoris]|uniref:hypothetical protein n=1 Tax=Blastococcus litoris TaxID=2171622 RepID=UPI000E306140|nr:hypothetical protein [Blastococcus litoris]
MNRVLAAARLQVVHPLVILGIPWLVVGISFAINVAIWGLAGLRDVPEAGFTGGVLALYITVCVVFVQAVTQLLPFAMGVSLSRRTYWLGVSLVGVLSALGYGIALAVLDAIGDATDGWGVGLSFWAPEPMQADNFFLQVLVSGAPMLAFIFSGIGMGVVVKRWGPNGLWALALAALLLFGGLAVLITGLGAWTTVGDWLGDRSLATLSIGLPLVVGAVVAALSFAGIRRVVP